MRWIFAILAYGLLTLACALALYFIEIGGIEQELADATEKALSEQLIQTDFRGISPRAAFNARRGHITGVAYSRNSVKTAIEETEKLAKSGLPADANARFPIAELSHDWKLSPHFDVFAQEETIALSGELSLSTLNKIKEAVKRATGNYPTAPIDPALESPAAEATAQDDVGVLKWEDTFADFVEFFFTPERVKNGRISVSKDQEVRLSGTVETKGARTALEDLASEDFPNLTIHNLVEVKRPFPSLLIEMEDDKIMVEGAVPTKEIQEALLAFIQSMGSPGQTFAPGIQIIAKAPEPNWFSSRPDFFRRYFKEVSEIEIIIGPDTATLGGRVSSKALAEELAKEVQAQLSSHTVESSLRYPEETP